MQDRVMAAGEHPVAYGVNTGRFSRERADYWAEAYLADPDGTAVQIAAMAPVLGPPAAAGRHVAGPGGEDDEFAHLFPPTPAQFDAIQAARAARVDAMSDEELEAELFGPGA